MKKSRVGGVIALASVLIVVGRGVASAETVPQVRDTSARYRMTLTMDKVTIQSVPNMAAAPLVREGYVTATAMLKIECMDKDQNNRDKCPAVTLSSLQMWAQVGCPNNLASGINLQPGGSIAAGVPGTLAKALPNSSDITTIGIVPQLSGNSPITATVLPGSITDVEIGAKYMPPTLEDLSKLKSVADLATKIQDDKAYAADSAMKADLEAVGDRIAMILNTPVTGPDGGLVVSVDNRHIVVDRSQQEQSAGVSCGGPVAIRMYASGTMRTATTSDKVDMFGDIYSL